MPGLAGAMVRQTTHQSRRKPDKPDLASDSHCVTRPVWSPVLQGFFVLIRRLNVDRYAEPVWFAGFLDSIWIGSMS
jgi:hypothetical protein